MERIVDTLVIKDKEVKCPICEHDKFWKRKTLMNTPSMSFFGLDFFNKEAQNYVCDDCGHVLWFLK